MALAEGFSKHDNPCFEAAEDDQTITAAPFCAPYPCRTAPATSTSISGAISHNRAPPGAPPPQGLSPFTPVVTAPLFLASNPKPVGSEPSPTPSSRGGHESASVPNPSSEWPVVARLKLIAAKTLNWKAGPTPLAPPPPDPIPQLLQIPEPILVRILSIAAEQKRESSSSSSRAMRKKTIFSIVGVCQAFRNIGNELFFAESWHAAKIVHPRALFTLSPSPGPQDLKRCFVIREPLKMGLMGILSRLTMYSGTDLEDPHKEFLMRADQLSKLKFVISTSRSGDLADVALLTCNMGRTQYSLRTLKGVLWVRGQPLVSESVLKGALKSSMESKLHSKHIAVQHAGEANEVYCSDQEEDEQEEEVLRKLEQNLDLGLPLMHAKYRLKVSNLTAPRKVVMELPQPLIISPSATTAFNKSSGLTAFALLSPSTRRSSTTSPEPPTPTTPTITTKASPPPIDLSALAVPRTIGVADSVDAVAAALHRLSTRNTTNITSTTSNTKYTSARGPLRRANTSTNAITNRSTDTSINAPRCPRPARMSSPGELGGVAHEPMIPGSTHGVLAVAPGVPGVHGVVGSAPHGVYEVVGSAPHGVRDVVGSTPPGVHGVVESAPPGVHDVVGSAPPDVHGVVESAPPGVHDVVESAPFADTASAATATTACPDASNLDACPASRPRVRWSCTCSEGTPTTSPSFSAESAATPSAIAASAGNGPGLRGSQSSCTGIKDTHKTSTSFSAESAAATAAATAATASPDASNLDAGPASRPESRRVRWSCTGNEDIPQTSPTSSAATASAASAATVCAGASDLDAGPASRPESRRVRWSCTGSEDIPQTSPTSSAATASAASAATVCAGASDLDAGPASRPESRRVRWSCTGSEHTPTTSTSSSADTAADAAASVGSGPKHIGFRQSWVGSADMTTATACITATTSATTATTVSADASASAGTVSRSDPSPSPESAPAIAPGRKGCRHSWTRSEGLTPATAGTAATAASAPADAVDASTSSAAGQGRKGFRHSWTGNEGVITTATAATTPAVAVDASTSAGTEPRSDCSPSPESAPVCGPWHRGFRHSWAGNAGSAGVATPAGTAGTAAATAAPGPGRRGSRHSWTGSAGVATATAGTAAIAAVPFNNIRKDTIADHLPPVIQLSSKLPAWNDAIQCWCLNFNGRVKAASVKNFQLVVEGDENNRTVMQYGKVTGCLNQVEDHALFSLDFNPTVMTPLQAFAMSLTSYGTKIMSP
eukprot:gene22755-29923_t